MLSEGGPLNLAHSFEQYLYSKGITKQGGTRPMPAEVVDPLGHCKSWESQFRCVHLTVTRRLVITWREHVRET